MSVRFPPNPVLNVAFPYIVEFLRRLGRIPAGPSLRATSWYRDAAANRRAKGLPDSQHLLAIAIDVDGDELELARFRRGADQAGLIAIDAGSHTHLQLLPAGLAREIGLFDRLAASPTQILTL